MGKETSQSHDQGPLSQTMRELRASNAEVGGTLFSTVGKGPEEAFVFPTFVERRERGIIFSEFLVFNSARVMLIQYSGHSKSEMDASQGDYYMDPNEMSQSIIRAQSKGGYKNSEGRERLEFRVDSLWLRIGAQTTTWKRPENLLRRVFESEYGGRYKGWRLVNPSEGKVEEILVANMERVKGNKLQVISQRVSGVLSRAS